MESRGGVIATQFFTKAFFLKSVKTRKKKAEEPSS